MIDEEMLDTVWEPTKYEVGDKVRVKLGECDQIGQGIDIMEGKDLGNKRHPMVLNNELGIVCKVDRSTSNGHYYTVVFTKVLEDANGRYVAGELASIELEPVEFVIGPNRESFMKLVCSTIGIEYPSAKNTDY